MQSNKIATKMYQQEINISLMLHANIVVFSRNAVQRLKIFYRYNLS